MRQEVLKFKGGLGYKVIWRPAWDTLGEKRTVEKKKRKRGYKLFLFVCLFEAIRRPNSSYYVGKLDFPLSSHFSFQ